MIFLWNICVQILTMILWKPVINFPLRRHEFVKIHFGNSFNLIYYTIIHVDYIQGRHPYWFSAKKTNSSNISGFNKDVQYVYGTIVLCYFFKYFCLLLFYFALNTKWLKLKSYQQIFEEKHINKLHTILEL